MIYYRQKNVIFLNLTCNPFSETNHKCYMYLVLKEDQSKVRALEKVRKLLNWQQNQSKKRGRRSETFEFT